MKTSTKALSWLWIVVGVGTAVNCLTAAHHLFRPGPMIAVLAILLFTVVPALSLLNGRRIGWQTISAVTLVFMLSLLIAAPRLMEMSMGRPIALGLLSFWLVTCAGLLVDYPGMRWASEPLREVPQRLVGWDWATAFILFVAASAIALLVVASLILGFDHTLTLVSRKISLFLSW